MHTVSADRRWAGVFRCLTRLAFLALVTTSAAAVASGPEQLEQLEPEGGEWQLEYSAVVSRGSASAHSVQLLRGLSDHLAVGIEAETEGSGELTLEGLAPTVVYRFGNNSRGINAGVAAQIEVDPKLKIASAEARIILEKKTRNWWAQGNFIARHVSEEDESGAALAYGWGLSSAIVAGFWIGAEGSGGVTRFAGSASAVPDGGHFLGPTITVEQEIAGSELEIGLAWQHRIAGQGRRDHARLVVQFGF